MSAQDKNEVEAFLRKLGMPSEVVDAFTEQGCDDLSAFLYLRADDLEEIPVDIAPWLWRRLSRRILLAIDNINGHVNDAWEKAELQDGTTVHYNSITLETRWTAPEQPRAPVAPDLLVEEDGEDEDGSYGGAEYYYWNVDPLPESGAEEEEAVIEEDADMDATINYNTDSSSSDGETDQKHGVYDYRSESFPELELPNNLPSMENEQEQEEQEEQDYSSSWIDTK